MTEAPLQSLQDIAEATRDPRVIAAWLDRQPDRYLSLLPLLEHALEDVVQDFPRALETAGAEKDLRETFSIDELILFALGWHGHWGAKAVAWLQQGAPLNEKMLTAIDHAVAEKYWTQKDRHIAFRLAQRWKRERNLRNSA